MISLICLSLLVFPEQGNEESEEVIFRYRLRDSSLVRSLREFEVLEQSRFTRITGTALRDSVIVHIASTRSEIDRLVAGFPEWGDAVTSPGQRLIVLRSHRIRRPSENLFQPVEVVFLHELAHMYLFDAAPVARIPRWFHEGVAMHLAHETGSDDILMRSKLTSSQLSLAEMEELLRFGRLRAQLAYEQSQATVEHLINKYGEGAIGDILNSLNSGLGFKKAFEASTSVSLQEFEREVLNMSGALSVWWQLTDELIWAGLIPILLILSGIVYFFRRRRLLREMEEEPEL